MNLTETECIVHGMSSVTISFLTALLLLVGTCGKEAPTPKSTWSVKLATSGGFAGIGTGNLSVSSDGKFHYEEPARPEVHKGCDGNLRAAQLQPISDAMAKVDPTQWNKPGLNVAAPDAFGYKLEVRMGSDQKPTTVQWYDNTEDQLPVDLKRLSEALLQTMKTACH